MKSCKYEESDFFNIFFLGEEKNKMKGRKHKNYSNILIRIVFFEKGSLLSNFDLINCFYLETVFVVF